MRRAERTREGKAIRMEVYRNDRFAAGDPRGHQTGQSDGPGAEYGEGIAGLRTEDIQNRTDPGVDAARKRRE